MSQINHPQASNAPMPVEPIPVKPIQRGLNIPAPIAILLVLLMVAGATWYVYTNVFHTRVVDKSQYDVAPNGAQLRNRSNPGGGGFVRPPQVLDPAAALEVVKQKLQAEIPPKSGLGVLNPGSFIDIRIPAARVRFAKAAGSYKADFAFSDVTFLPLQDRGASIAKWNALQANSDQAKRANVTPEQVEKLKAVTFPLMVVTDADRTKLIELAKKYGAAAAGDKPNLEPEMITAFREVAINSLKPTQDAYHAAAEQVRGILDNNQINILRSNQ